MTIPRLPNQILFNLAQSITFLRKAPTGLLIVSIVTFIGCSKHNRSSKLPGSAILPASTIVDLGSLNEGDEKAAEISLSNQSRFPVSIKRITASCGCTTANVDHDFIRPGEHTMLRVKLTSPGRYGSFQSLVNILWQEEAPGMKPFGQATITFHTEALYVARTDPSEVNFGSLNNIDEPITRSISLFRGTQRTPYVDVMTTDFLSGMKTVAEKSSDDRWTISVRISPKQLPAGVLRSHFDVIFRDSKSNEIFRKAIPVRMEIRGLVQPKPALLFFGSLPQGTEKSGKIAFTAPKGEHVAIKSAYVEQTAKCVDLNWTPPEQASTQTTLQYELHTEGISGAISGQLRIDFTNPKFGRLSIPYYAYIKPSEVESRR